MSSYKNDILANNNELSNILTKIDELPAPINGLIEEYKVAAGENINAGDFVSWLNGDGTLGEQVQLSATKSSGNRHCATLISKDKVFVAFIGYDGGDYRAYGIVCIINGLDITVGTQIRISGPSNYVSSNGSINIAKIADDKVFVVYSQSTNYERLSAIVCTVDGTAITAGVDTLLLNGSQYMAVAKSVVALSENKVFIAHSGSQYYPTLKAMVCTINGTTITAGTDTLISSESYSGSGIDVVLLNEDKVFIAHTVGYYKQLYAVICTINGTTITVGSDTAINTLSNYGTSFSATALSENKVFIIHSTTSTSTGSFNAVICTIDGTAIVVGTDTVVLPASNAYYSNFCAIAFSENEIFIAYRSPDSFLSCIICKIVADEIIPSEIYTLNSNQYSGEGIGVAMLNKGLFLITYSFLNGENYYLKSLIVSFKSGIIPFSDTIFGIANTSGTDGDTIQVYIPQT